MSSSPVLFGKYQLLELLARGGMAEVFKAKSHGALGFEKVLVIKRILPELGKNPQFVEMFVNEAKIAVSLSHANIVQVFDLGRSEGSFYIAMEYVAGYDLATILRRAQRYSRPLPIELALFIASELAKGLDYAHRRRDADQRPLHIVHRDVSPQNVLVSFEGEVKLTDFGIAKAMSIMTESTAHGVLKGKYAYMSPEQARGESVDHRSDLFALGIVLYELLTGVSPFESGSSYETLKRVQEGVAPPLREHDPDLPDDLVALVERALRPLPDERPAHAGVLYEDMLQFLYGSGRRVGAHDLARYVQELRDLSEQRDPKRAEARLRAAFSIERFTSEHPSAAEHPAPTPVEVPSRSIAARRQSQAALPTALGADSSAERKSLVVGRATTERREVTVLVIRGAALERSALTSLPLVIARYGGELVNAEASFPERVVVFGARDPDGREVESAVRCGLKIARLARTSGRPPPVQPVDAELASSEGVTGDLPSRPLPVQARPPRSSSSPAIQADSSSRLAAEPVWIADAPSGFLSPLELQLGVHAARIHVDAGGLPIVDDLLERAIDGARSAAMRAPDLRVVLSAAAADMARELFETEPDATSLYFTVIRERSATAGTGRFVGRRAELRQLGELLALANRKQLGVIVISGEPGAGKTRLLHETRRRLELGGHDVGLYIASCTRQGRGAPLSGVQEMLRAVLGVDELDPPQEIEAKVARVRELGLSLRDQTILAGALHAGRSSTPLSIAIEPGSSASARVDPIDRLLRPALGRMALKLGQDRLTVFAFDGAEWLDRESLEIIETLAHTPRGARVAVILACRTGLVPVFRTEIEVHRVELGPLDDDEIAKLAAHRLGFAPNAATPDGAPASLPASLVRELAAKAAGNPFFAEEYIKALADAGAITWAGDALHYRPEVAEVEVPKTLRGLVAARLSRLGSRERHLLQIASVIGPRFGADVIAMVAGEEVREVEQSLALLHSGGLLRRSGADHGFTHELVGEVLREGLTLETRRDMHRSIAIAFETIYPERIDELAERLAQHWREAGDRARAIELLERAADRLAEEKSPELAIGALERALDLLTQLPVPDHDRQLSLLYKACLLASSAPLLAGGALERSERGAELAEALRRDAWLARFSLLHGRALAARRKLDEAQRWLDRAGDVARTIDDRSLFFEVVLATAIHAIDRGDPRSGLHHLEQALGLARALGDGHAERRALIPLALARASAGAHEEAMRALDAARACQGEIDRSAECELRRAEALVHQRAGAYARAAEVAQEAVELAKEYGLFAEAAAAAHDVGVALLHAGDERRAFASLRYSSELCRELGLAQLGWSNLRMLGFIDAMRFGREEGLGHVLEANRAAEESGAITDLVVGRYLLAMIRQIRGELELARSTLREVLRLAADHGQAKYVTAAERALEAVDRGEPISLPG